MISAIVWKKLREETRQVTYLRIPKFPTGTHWKVGKTRRDFVYSAAESMVKSEASGIVGVPWALKTFLPGWSLRRSFWEQKPNKAIQTQGKEKVQIRIEEEHRGVKDLREQAAIYFENNMKTKEDSVLKPKLRKVRKTLLSYTPILILHKNEQQERIKV